MALWNSFQSVIQLSIASNVAFATLSPFIGSSAQRHSSLTEHYVLQLEHYEDVIINSRIRGQTTRDLHSSVSGLMGKFEGIKQESAAADEKIADFLNGRIRIVCLLTSALSLAVLFVSSYASSTEEMPTVWHVYIYAQFLPVIIGVTRIILLFRQHNIIKNKIQNELGALKTIETNFKSLKHRIAMENQELTHGA